PADPELCEMRGVHAARRLQTAIVADRVCARRVGTHSPKPPSCELACGPVRESRTPEAGSPMPRSTWYLGAARPLHLSPHDPRESARLELPPHHLVTHGVVVGMTGSGKTGLLTVMLEEALRSGVPALLIDVKGDLP